jgi:hypothetical protein
MSNLPRRSRQHVSEDISIRVFQRCLPAHWIFRDQGTRNDYGIDAEVELVGASGEMRGHIAKVQLKGKQSVKRDRQGRVSVGGIKQSTLRYWLSLSRYANVILAITDNGAEDAYFTAVFWPATKLLDAADRSKTLKFNGEWSLKSKVGPVLFAMLTIQRPWEIVRHHEDLLRALPRVLHDFLWVCQADAWTIHEPSEVTERWLRSGRGLMGVALEDEDLRLFDFRWWCAESERVWGDSPMRGTIRETYTKTFALVFPQMAAISERVLEGRYFWSREAPEYMALVENTPVPIRYDWEGITAFVAEHKIAEPWY